MQILAVGKALVLLIVANGTPVVVSKIAGSGLSHPLDGGRRFVDGRPLFGASKTFRGMFASLVATTLVAAVLDIPWLVGALFALSAMAGDLISSFLKRRLGLAPSSKAPGLDQIPESLLPLLVCQAPLGLSALDVMLCVAAFVVLEVLFSPLLYWLHLRDRPY